MKFSSINITVIYFSCFDLLHFFDISDNVVCETDGRGIFLENSLEGILDACVMTWPVEEDTFAGGL